MNHRIISAILVLAFASVACGFSVELPEQKQAGPEIVDEISIPLPKAEQVELKIEFGAGKLTLRPGAEDMLVEGTVTYNLDELKPEITIEDEVVQISQGDYQFDEVVTMNKIKNDWVLELGETPMDLRIDAGAYNGMMELGELALTSLTIHDGAAHTEVTFSAPNQAEMSMLQYETGASNVKLTGLGNANFENMIFRAGAGDYELDFSGELQRDATINIDCGLSDITLHIPEDVFAVVSVGGGLNNVSTSSGWSQNGSTYTQEGQGPKLTFVIDMGAGNLTLTD